MQRESKGHRSKPRHSRLSRLGRCTVFCSSGFWETGQAKKAHVGSAHKHGESCMYRWGVSETTCFKSCIGDTTAPDLACCMHICVAVHDITLVCIWTSLHPCTRMDPKAKPNHSSCLYYCQVVLRLTFLTSGCDQRCWSGQAFGPLTTQMRMR